MSKIKLVNGWYLPYNDIFNEKIVKDNSLQIQKNTIIDFLKKNTCKMNYAIDVNAHFGFWTKDLCLHFKKVLAFEPILENRMCLSKNIESINFEKKPWTLGNKNDVFKIIYDERISNEYKILHKTESFFEEIDTNYNIDIKMIKAQPFFKNVDYIHIDTSGYEIEVCEGGIDFIKNDKPFIHIKQNKKNKSILHSFFKSLNYRQIFKINDDIIFASL